MVLFPCMPGWFETARDDGMPMLTMQTEAARATIEKAELLLEQVLDRTNSNANPQVLNAVLGVECSDGYSGLTANPAVGVVSDRIVACGGIIISETTELYGATPSGESQSVTEVARGIG